LELARAKQLGNEISYKPGWAFAVETNRKYSGVVTLKIWFQVRNSDVKYAPEYLEPVVPVPLVEFWLRVDDCDNDLDFYGKVFECVLQVERHEAREFFAVDGQAYDKPFHPHTPHGMTNWAERKPVTEAEDMPFGVLVHV